MASRPTGKSRKSKQKLKQAYAKTREDAQRAGLIPTTPEGAVRPEVVDPESQDSQRFPGLDRLAIQTDGKGWSVPEHVKRKVVEQAAEVLFERRFREVTVTGPDGDSVTVQVEVPPDRRAQSEAARTLLVADQRQHERDDPEAAGKAKGGTNVTIDNSTKVAILNRMLAEARGAGAGGGAGDAPQLPAADEPGRGDDRGAG